MDITLNDIDISELIRRGLKEATGLNIIAVKLNKLDKGKQVTASIYAELLGEENDRF